MNKKLLFILLIFFQIMLIFPEEDKIKINIRAGTVEEEINYIKYLIKRMNFFNSYGYNIILPEDPVINDLVNKSLKNDLKENDFQQFEILFREKIYDIKKYEQGINNILKVKEGIEKVFPIFKKYNKAWGFKIMKEYNVLLTLYGPGGSYDYKKGNITMLTNEKGEFKRGNNPVDTIIHEMTHIGIEEIIIIKYDLSHTIKERIVDKFVKYHFKDILPGYELQSIGNKSIDAYLDKNNSWENLPEIIMEFKKQK